MHYELRASDGRGLCSQARQRNSLMEEREIKNRERLLCYFTRDVSGAILGAEVNVNEIARFEYSGTHLKGKGALNLTIFL